MARKNQTVLALDAVTSAGDSEVLGGYNVGDKITVQVNVGTSASVTVLGRLAPTAPWVTITTAAITADSIVRLEVATPEILVRAAGVTGALSVWVRAD